MPLSLIASYCFSFFTCAAFCGILTSSLCLSPSQFAFPLCVCPLPSPVGGALRRHVVETSGAPAAP
jgi:hypothetical protein